MAKQNGERKQARREAREQRVREEAEREAAERRQRLARLVVAGVFALVIVIVVVVVVATGGEDEEEGESAPEVERLYDGIPQSGTLLGDPGADVTLVEFADLQCPFCARYSTRVLPALIEDYVRPGDLRMELNLLTFLGPDSAEAAEVAAAASLQDRMWQFADVFYRDQGVENSGYVDEGFLEEVGSQVAGLDMDAAFDQAGSQEVQGILADAEARATELGVDSTPSFFLVTGGGEPEPLEPAALEANAFRAPIEDAIGN